MKKTLIPQSTYGKTAKYISSSTQRFAVTMDEQTYLKLLRLAESGNTSRNLYLAALVNQTETGVNPPPVVLPCPRLSSWTIPSPRGRRRSTFLRRLLLKPRRVWSCPQWDHACCTCEGRIRTRKNFGRGEVGTGSPQPLFLSFVGKLLC